MELKVHPSFFREFATKTWISPYEIIRELIENAFDEDATNVIVTVLNNGNIVIEDNAGMNSDSMNKFLILGSPHKSEETLSPKLKRIRTGRYGTGRLSFLTSFDQMKVKTRLDDFNKSIIIDGNTLEDLIGGHAKLHEVKETKLNRNGTEILLIGSKISVDINRLAKEIKKLSILKYPLFEVYIKSAENINEWDLAGSQIIRSPDIQGYRIGINRDNPKITGEIIIARRPLGQDEKGIAIMVGNHVVLRSTFGFDNKLSRVTGYVKCDDLTSRFADKSALIENDVYHKFNQSIKEFIVERILPSLTEYEDVLITREESKIYKEIDKVMGQAVLETLEPVEEIQGFETVEITSQSNENELDSTNGQQNNQKNTTQLRENYLEDQNYEDSYKNKLQSNSSSDVQELQNEEKHIFDDNKDSRGINSLNSVNMPSTSASVLDNDPHNKFKAFADNGKLNFSNSLSGLNTSDSVNNNNNNIDNDTFMNGLVPNNDNDNDMTYLHDQNIGIRKTVRKPILKKTFTLKKIGYKVVPYEDETDQRYSFTNENVVFVNKAHSTYKVEAERGDEFLFRHITNIVAEVVVGSKYPEARDILEIQNKLISEAIKIHDYALLKK